MKKTRRILALILIQKGVFRGETDYTDYNNYIDYIDYTDHAGYTNYTGNDNYTDYTREVKVARYSFSRSIPPKFEHKLRRHKQRFGKIDTTVV